MHKKGSAFITMGLLLIAAALLLTGYNIWDGNRADQAARGTVESLWSMIPNYMDNHPDAVPAASTEPQQPEDLEGEELTELPEIEPSADFSAIPEREMPTKVIDGYRYIGVLDVPSMDLSLPVMEEWDYDRLRVSPCRFAGNVYQDNLVIAAHNYPHHFSPLKYASLGTLVTFTDMDGTEFRYTIVSIETVGPNDVDTMIYGEWDLTLFTCNTGGQTRCAIRCDLIDE